LPGTCQLHAQTHKQPHTPPTPPLFYSTTAFLGSHFPPPPHPLSFPRTVTTSPSPFPIICFFLSGLDPVFFRRGLLMLGSGYLPEELFLGPCTFSDLPFFLCPFRHLPRETRRHPLLAWISFGQRLELAGQPLTLVEPETLSWAFLARLSSPQCSLFPVFHVQHPLICSFVFNVFLRPVAVFQIHRL